MDDRTIKILIAEDDGITALSIVEFFSLNGYKNVKIVPSGTDAIREVTDDPPGILFIDIQLAGNINGVDAALKIRETSDVPIAFMSGFISRENRDKAEMISPVAYLDKPLIIRDIMEVVAKAAAR